MANKGRPANLIQKSTNPTVVESESSRIASTDNQVRIAIRPNAVVNASTRGVNGYLGVLPLLNSDIHNEIGLTEMDRMYNDPQIAASCETIILQACSRGLRVKPRYIDSNDPLYAPAIKAYDLVCRALDILDCYIGNDMGLSINDHIEDMARSRMKYGNNAAEVTFDLIETGPMAGNMVPCSIQPLNPRAYSYVMDAYGQCMGIAVYSGKGEASALPSGSLLPMPGIYNPLARRFETDIDALPESWTVVPIGKFLTTAHRRKHGDPRGTSCLTSAFTSWFMSMQIWPEYLKYLSQFAGPSLFATLPEHAVGRRDENGEITSPIDVLYEELLNFANGSAICAQFGTKIEPLHPTGEGQAFVQAINVLNHEKVKAILHSTLATEQSGSQTRAAQQGGKDILDLPATSLRNGMTSMMERQLFAKIVYFNMGPQAAQLLTPRADLGDISPEDRAEFVRALSMGGFQFLPSQHNQISSLLDIDPASPSDIATLTKAAETAAEGTQVKPAGGQTSNGNAPKSPADRQDRPNDSAK